MLIARNVSENFVSVLYAAIQKFQGGLSFYDER